MIDMLTDPTIWASFLTLTLLEVVLGIDNIIFLSIITGKLPPKQQPMARLVGLALALIMRIVLLAGVVWLAHLNETLFSAFGQDISWRDIVLIGGGLFLLYKATTEIHHEMEGAETEGPKKQAQAFGMVIAQIVAIDLVFSLDSIFTAVGITDVMPVIVAAIVIAILVMLFAATPVSAFVNAHPTVKMLALAFLILIGIVLVADGLDFHIPREYLYFAIAFSVGTESLNLIAKKKRILK